MLVKQKHPLAILGLGNYSTLFYLRKLNELYHEKYGGYSTCPLIMLNANFNELNPFLPQQFTKLKPITKKYLHEIEQLGGENIVIPNITLHQTIDLLKLPRRLKIIHPVHETANELLRKGHKQVIIFGTAYTMSTAYIPSIFSQYGINCISPDVTDAGHIDQIRKDIYTGNTSRELLKQFQLLIEKYMKMGQVVLCCTELSVASEQIPNLAVTDMAICQIQAGLSGLA